MKKLGWFNKGIFYINIVLTILTFTAYILPFLAPKLFPLLSVFTLFLPLMLILNLLFFMQSIQYSINNAITGLTA